MDGVARASVGGECDPIHFVESDGVAGPRLDTADTVARGLIGYKHTPVVTQGGRAGDIGAN